MHGCHSPRFPQPPTGNDPLTDSRTKREQRQGSALGALCVTLVWMGTSGATAQERVLAPSMPCAGVAALVETRGAVVISTGPFTFDRVVRDQSFCELETTTAPAYVPSADLRLCFAGYRCRPIEREGKND